MAAKPIPAATRNMQALIDRVSDGRLPIVVVAVIAVVLLLYVGAPFFIPFFIALLIAYALAPLVDVLTRLVRWRALAAGLVVGAMVGLVAAAAWGWSDDVETLWRELPVAAKTISKSVQRMARQPAGPMAEVKKAAAEIESIAQTGKTAPPAVAPAAPSISVWSVLWTGWKGVMVAGSQVMVVLFLVFFMLASGDLFKRKIVSIIGDSLSEKRVTVEAINEIDEQIRRYLVVLLVSNLLVGFLTWIAFHLMGVRYPGLWGVAAAILHTAPYFGPAIIAVGSLIAAFLQFGDWTQAALVAGATVLIATIVGAGLATWLAARQMRMNTTASFVGLLFFAWIWGLWGLLLGIPILAIVKSICERTEDWKPVAQLLEK